MNCPTEIEIPNLTEPCGGNYISTDCLNIPQANPVLDLPANSKQTEVNAALTTALIYKEQQIVALQEAIDAKPYKVYTALLTQTLTDAPTVIVLENTLEGTVVLSYSAVGSYVATLTGAFTLNKTWCSITSTAGADVTLTAGRGSDNTINIKSFLSGTLSNSAMSPACLEIRVYN